MLRKVRKIRLVFLLFKFNKYPSNKLGLVRIFFPIFSPRKVRLLGYPVSYICNC